MANRTEAFSVIAIAGFTLFTACAGLYLGFLAPRAQPHGKPIPHTPDTGPIVYEMRSVISEPNRVRLEWREVPGALGYRIKVMSAAADSLFGSSDLSTTAWTIPSNLAARLAPRTLYHWQVTVVFLSRTESSEPSAFATQ